MQIPSRTMRKKPSRRRPGRRTLVVTLLAVLLLQAAFADAAGGWVWPVRGRVITPYANDNARPYAGGMHRGIDIGAPVGEPVVAAEAGEVTYAAPLGSAGLTVAVRTADGRYLTSYLHLSRIATSRGASVAAGEKLGEVGTSGRRSAEEPHLHFGVRLASAENLYVDPLTLLPPLPTRPGEGPAPPLAAPAPAPVRQAPAPAGARPVPLTTPVPRGRHSPVMRPMPARRPLPAGRPLPAARSLPAGAPSPAPARPGAVAGGVGLPAGAPSAGMAAGNRHAAGSEAASESHARAGAAAARAPLSGPLGARGTQPKEVRPAGGGPAPSPASGGDEGSGLDRSRLLLALGAALVLAALVRSASGLSARVARALAAPAHALGLRLASASRSSRSARRARAAMRPASGRGAWSPRRALP